MQERTYEEASVLHIYKDHEELYDKTNIHFKDRVRKVCLWERFVSEGVQDLDRIPMNLLEN